MHNLPNDDDELAKIAAQAMFNGFVLLTLLAFALGFALGCFL